MKFRLQTARPPFSMTITVLFQFYQGVFSFTQQVNRVNLLGLFKYPGRLLKLSGSWSCLSPLFTSCKRLNLYPASWKEKKTERLLNIHLIYIHGILWHVPPLHDECRAMNYHLSSHMRLILTSCQTSTPGEWRIRIGSCMIPRITALWEG